MGTIIAARSRPGANGERSAPAGNVGDRAGASRLASPSMMPPRRSGRLSIVRSDRRHDDLSELRHAESRPASGSAAQCGTRLDAGCPSCGAANSRRAEVLRRLRHGSRGRRSGGGQQAGDVGSRAPPDRAATTVRPRTGAGRGAPPRLGPVRGPRRLHAVRRGARRGGGARDADPLLRRSRSEVIERYGGMVEKFIGDAVMAVWGTPTAHEDDAERAVRAALELVDAVRALGPGIDARAGVLTGRGRGHARRHEPGHGRRRPREHRGADPVGRRAGHRPRRRGDVPRRQRVDRVRGGRRADAQGQGRAGPGLARAAGGRRARRPRPVGRCSRRRSSGATTSCACSRTSTTRRRARAGRASCRSPGIAGHRQEPPRLGVREVPRRRSSSGSGGTTGARPRTARASRSGRWARWSAGGAAWPRPTTRRRRGRSSPTTVAERHRPTSRSGAGSRPSLLALLGRRDPGRRPGGAVRRLADLLRAPRGDRTRGHGVRGPPLGRRRHARLHRPPARLGADDPAHDHHARPARAPRPPPGLGRRPPDLQRPRPRAAPGAGDARPARRPRPRPPGGRRAT